MVETGHTVAISEFAADMGEAGELTRLLFLRHLSHAALTLVGSCRVAEV